MDRKKKQGLVYPVGRVHRSLRQKHCGAVTKTAAVYMAGVLEYLTREVVEVTSEAAAADHRKRISSRLIFLSIQSDDELMRLYNSLGMVIPGAGVVPVTTLAPGKKKPTGSARALAATGDLDRPSVPASQ